MKEEPTISVPLGDILDELAGISGALCVDLAAARAGRKAALAALDAADTGPQDLKGLLTAVVVAADRMRDGWAEGDDERKRELWKALHTAADAAGDVVYPVPRGPQTAPGAAEAPSAAESAP